MSPTTKAAFVYVTYISTTPEKLWNALIDPEMTKQYWARHRNASDWKVGSRWSHEDYDDPKLVDIVGTVVESDPPRRLVVTWEGANEGLRNEKPSRVTYLIEPYRDAVRLTVTHEALEPDSGMLRGITAGWPAVLSGLKTLLETGQPMPMMALRWSGPPE
jgi:uncharacterized protein YndB with AHSA1/START domain